MQKLPPTPAVQDLKQSKWIGNLKKYLVLKYSSKTIEDWRGFYRNFKLHMN
jgi:hypothetical protein